MNNRINNPRRRKKGARKSESAEDSPQFVFLDSLLRNEIKLAFRLIITFYIKSWALLSLFQANTTQSYFSVCYLSVFLRVINFNLQSLEISEYFQRFLSKLPSKH